MEGKLADFKEQPNRILAVKWRYWQVVKVPLGEKKMKVTWLFFKQ